MIRFCQNSACGRGFVDVERRKKGDEVPMLCAQCRRPGGKPLSKLVGGRSREEAERRQVERERDAAR